ncbi:unnamed protein product [Peronospora destructor]|uniref:Tf2-1-like SH3-like domain-containing protein n=1 Tax=Peronospora destructor TaxID=86335 RepID=A0AAV0T3Q9_9STRA|nr:unnamed protein product [Peronospora destructor]
MTWFTPGRAAALCHAPKRLPSVAHSSKSANVTTRSQAKKPDVAPHCVAPPLANYAPKIPARPIDDAAVSDFILHRQSVTRYVRDALQEAVDEQKENADKRGRNNMDIFLIGDKVLLSTDELRNSAVTNLSANKLAPRFIGPFTILKTIGDAYTLDIPTSLRLHPTFYVGRLKRYNPDNIPEDARRVESVTHRSSIPRDGPDVQPTFREAAFPSVVVSGIDVPTSSSIRVTLDSTGVSQQQSSQHEQHVPKPLQPPVGHRPPGSPLHPHHPGQPGREPYRRDGPPPLVDSAGDVRWIVDHILGFPPEKDFWEPRSSLLREIPDVVHDSESKKAVIEGILGRPEVNASETDALVNANENDALLNVIAVVENTEQNGVANESPLAVQTPVWWSGFLKLCDKIPNHSLCRTADLRRGYLDAAYRPSLTLCTRRLAGRSLRNTGYDVNAGLERGRPGGAQSGYASLGEPAGGHSIDLVESELITNSSGSLSSLAFSLVVSGVNHLAFTLIPNH